MWNDNETNIDFIDYQHHVNAVLSLIHNDELLPCTIGIFGDWGSGKSSLMKMVADNITDKDSLVIKFNGWLFEGYDDAKTVLMGKIVDEIIKKRTLTDKAIKAGANLLRKIDFMKVGSTLLKYGAGFATMGPAGIAALSILDIAKKATEEDYEKYVKEKKDNPDDTLRHNIQEFHANFQELISETKINRLVVIIDDLDRCLPDTIIATLEAIKLFLFTEKTAFLLGADERLIKYAVRKRFPEIPGEAAEVGRDYLEKLIQFPVRIPPLNSTELQTYINLLFCKLYLTPDEFETLRTNVMKEKVTKGSDFIFNSSNIQSFHSSALSNEIKEGLSLSDQLYSVLAIGLNGNPRQCKRFLNTLLLRYGMAESRKVALKKRVLAKLMLLEYFKPETFKKFHALQAENGGVIKQMKQLESSAIGQGSSVKEKSSGSEIDFDLEVYLQDGWIRNWLSSEPSLKDENLQPYYYFSRDTLVASSIHLQRMSPIAQEVFKRLVHTSDAVRLAALGDAKNLNEAEASSIFEGLTEKIKQEEQTQESKPNLFEVLFEFIKVRKELLSQLISFIEQLPESNIPITVVTRLEDVTKGSGVELNVKRIVEKWSKSVSNIALAKICKAKIKSK